MSDHQCSPSDTSIWGKGFAIDGAIVGGDENHEQRRTCPLARARESGGRVVNGLAARARGPGSAFGAQHDPPFHGRRRHPRRARPHAEAP